MARTGQEVLIKRLNNNAASGRASQLPAGPVLAKRVRTLSTAVRVELCSEEFLVQKSPVRPGRTRTTTRGQNQNQGPEPGTRTRNQNQGPEPEPEPTSGLCSRAHRFCWPGSDL